MADKSQTAQNRSRGGNKLTRNMPSWLASTAVHLVVLVVLALCTLPGANTAAVRQLLISSDEQPKCDDLEKLRDKLVENLQVELSGESVAVEADTSVEKTDISPIDDLTAAAVSVDLSDISLQHALRSDLLTQVGTYMGKSLSGRGDKSREGLVSSGGGSAESEQAVEAALGWLAAHQLRDGGWSFDHTRSQACGGRCRNPGKLSEARAAATGLALLPFLGAGQTHKSGKYQKTVRQGLAFLKKRIVVSRGRGSFIEPGGMMYSHGIASIALCEAYAMTKDKTLRRPAQQAVEFLGYAQDPVGGGWRYSVQTPGDTSVTGWQIMALKSADMGYLMVPKGTLAKAYAFLDSVQYDDGGRYRYMTMPGPGDDSPALTAVGLLCRMYFGWKKSNPALERGVRWISETGPSDEIYFNYYATQVMRHWGGKPWRKWNAVMRDRLVNSQAKSGHEAGSWYWHRPESNHEQLGGRLYCTTMAVMILEVYYRHLPIYAQRSVQREFPID